MTPSRGEVWLFDCGMVEKVRPVLILSVPEHRESGGGLAPQEATLTWKRVVGGYREGGLTTDGRYGKGNGDPLNPWSETLHETRAHHQRHPRRDDDGVE
jgi:hypothetical protein